MLIIFIVKLTASASLRQIINCIMIAQLKGIVKGIQVLLCKVFMEIGCIVITNHLNCFLILTFNCLKYR